MAYNLSLFPEKPRNRLFRDMSGQRFGRLAVIAFWGTDPKHQVAWWGCLCDCGKWRCVMQRSLVKKGPSTRSCGCWNRDNPSRWTRGGLNKQHKRAYMTWYAMVDRCHNPAHDSYRDYGGRGIAVCERWREFANFLADMGDPPRGLSIERINNDAGYEPGNCKWATRIEQCNNKRVSRFLEYQGKRQTFGQWERETGISRGAIAMRIKMGWTVERALNQPPLKKPRRKRLAGNL